MYAVLTFDQAAKDPTTVVTVQYWDSRWDFLAGKAPSARDTMHVSAPAITTDHSNVVKDLLIQTVAGI